ncbi:type I methionyl aminopeptidase [Chondromyces apiculatus]|uniref:Methionine aminopeptidase n=1 Tax=Chondromyces apiculatus DSM 436 TaxID=1192034 RepID=A0A017T0B8_9BACT|nr:type I methionyl aminopeptidase [Chondromyces apiculatus]EYF02653.1 Methionine aminopeptidase [Chondromyces apiculatus DSM 436]
MSVEIKSMRDIEAMRVIGRIAGEQLLHVGRLLKAGMTTDDINTIVHEDTLRRGAKPSQLGYHGFPKSVCTSRNAVVCHGIPGPERLKEGDIINVDITSHLNGFHGDTSATFYIGTPSKEARHVTEVCRRALELGIAEVKEGARLGDVGAAIQQYAEGQGCSVVRGIVGHGIGRTMHGPPDVSHVGKRGTGLRLKAGMVFTIEPMINYGGHEIEHLADGWTIMTKDRSLSAQFEHTVVVTKSGCEILTARREPLVGSEVTATGERLAMAPEAVAMTSMQL